MNIRKRFTIWYVQRGYTFDPRPNKGCTDSVFECPFWVKPLLIFFSPSVYTHIVYGNFIYKNLVGGLIKASMADSFSYVLRAETEYYPPVNHDDYDEHENDMYYIGDSEKGD